MKPDYKLVAKAKYIHMTADLASEVWHEVYKRYFPAKQLDALVDSLQSADAIEEDVDNDVNYFLVFLGSSLIGYFAWKMENTSLHLLHLYLKPEYRGKAIGRDIVASCERLARGEGRGRVWCGVNAKALPVQQFFKARGYRSLGPAESEGGIERNELNFERMMKISCKGHCIFFSFVLHKSSVLKYPSAGPTSLNDRGGTVYGKGPSDRKIRPVCRFSGA